MKSVESIKSVFLSTTNPMAYDGEDLINIITMVVMPDPILRDICSRDDIGQQHYEQFVRERIASDQVNLWSPMKKAKLKVWTDARKVVRQKVSKLLLSLKMTGPSLLGCS